MRFSNSGGASAKGCTRANDNSSNETLSEYWTYSLDAFANDSLEESSLPARNDANVSLCSALSSISTPTSTNCGTVWVLLPMSQPIHVLFFSCFGAASTLE